MCKRMDPIEVYGRFPHLTLCQEAIHCIAFEVCEKALTHRVFLTHYLEWYERHLFLKG